MSDEQTVVSLWNEIKSTIENLEADVAKNARGVVAAGARARKGLRLVKRHASDLVKLMITLDKAHKAETK